MGRLIAVILGGAALALYIPAFLPVQLEAVNDLWNKLLGDWWHGQALRYGAGIFTGLGLVLLAVRGRE
jgi:hypothetical protein